MMISSGGSNTLGHGSSSYGGPTSFQIMPQSAQHSTAQAFVLPSGGSNSMNQSASSGQLHKVGGFSQNEGMKGNTNGAGV